MEGNRTSSGSGTIKQTWPKDEFTDLVLSWSLQDIYDEDLYQHQVEKIPESFESVDSYLGSYIFPLLEETRAELASATETVYNAPFAEVTSFSEQRHGKFLYDVKVDDWRNRLSDGGRDPYKTLPGDLVLISDVEPKTISDLLRVGFTYTLASVINIEDDGSDNNCASSSFALKSSREIDFGDGQGMSLYVVYLVNITPLKRIWNALHVRRNLTIVDKLLAKNNLSEEICDVCCHKDNAEMEEKLGSTLFSKLNESQLDAILSCLSKSECDHKPSVELIWGPPGTGKTATLSRLLFSLLKKKVRTLICAPTNVAIKELASRVIALVRNKSEENNLSCPLGDMLIFGNKDRLKVSSDIEEIFLEYRVERLVSCLGSLTGWKNCISSMLDFLQDCVSHHQIFVENELIKAKQSPEHVESISLLEFVRDRFPRLATPLRDCMTTFFTHLPRNPAHEQQIFRNIKQLMSLLDSVEVLLFEDNSLTSKTLERIFLREGTVDSASSLMYMRSQCLNILRSLRGSLDKLGLPNGIHITSTTELCFKNATLIFCTTSSAYKLHTVEMEPFNMLVIDEAAQVKECESIIALQIPGVRHAILVGDECQLPATVKSKVSEEAGYGRSLFERLSSLGHSKHLLDVQYRMHPSISRFPNSNFYDNQILDAPSVRSRSYERCYLQGRIFGPYSFIDIPGDNEELDDFGYSRKNMVEVAVTVMLVQKLFKAWNGSNEKLSIGLISPYAAQVAAIRDKLQRKYEKFDKFIVNVKSIDGFQGGEEDIIIISTVRSHKGGSIGFLSSPQRTNVALTRARHCLWILGNERTLSKSDSVWEALISDAKQRDRFFTADEDCDIRKAVIDVTKELDQLEDLLSGKSILFKNSRWKVVFSDNFRKSFQKLKPSNVKKLAITVLLKLASGWRPKNINVNCKCESSSYIVKQIKVAKYYVICSIDLIKDPVYVQILKVWDILPMTETTKLLKRLDSIFAMYTDDFINRCNEKLYEGHLEMPKSWSACTDIIRFKNLNNTKVDSNSASGGVDCRSHVENAKVSESLLLMKFYSLSSDAVSHLLLSDDVEGREVDLPFEVTDEEREIIMFPRSSFILGRSGTGKTTILTIKLYQKLQHYCMATRDSMAANNSVQTLHQLFVTVSPKLCYAVKKHVSHLKSFASENASVNNNLTDMDDLDEMAEFRDIPDTFVGIEPEKYPLIITFHKFLMMLDGTLGNSYFERFRDVRGSSQCQGRRSIALQTFIRRNEVTYDRFRSLYWPHLNAKLTKNIDPSRVFTEIMSHIKGGLKEGESGETKRSRDGYVSLSESRVSTLNAEKRDVIYDIFEDYEKMKLERGEFDLADFVIDIHLRLKNEEDLIGDKMDLVYIDEVQDLTMRQISLFRFICKNIDEGFVFCGDTAQTIARGIDFRFEDIRSLFYNEFYMKSRKCGRREKGLVSDTFCLSQNFRTHTGVLRLAQSVIDLICHFFPQSIDVLPPETSLIYGESPVVLEPGSDENLIMSIFGHSGHDAGKWVGFGADQVILVRDESARREIFNYIGKQALVLTIVECKGLEFQDVLLYNFFGSSPMSDQWRVLYEFLKEKDLLDASTPKSFPSFSESRHNILCSELKQLYVAITRTRQRLWICENNEQLSKPILDYWRRLCLVQVRKIDDSLALAMQRASSPEEWKSQGIKLFWEKNYEMATVCFEKAGEEKWEKRAKASGLRASADSLRGSNPKEARVMLREAAEIFDSIDRADSAADCFCDLEEYERAGKIYLEKCGTSELRKAGECFSLAGNYKIAAEVYNKGKFFDECLSACTKGNHFDLGLQYIEQWKSFDTGIMTRFKGIDKIAQEFLEKCALECNRKNDSASMMKFVCAFCTDESKRNLLKSLDCLEDLLKLEEECGNFKEAVEIAQQLGGHILREIDLLEKAKDFRNASLLIISYVFNNSLWVYGSQGWPLKSCPQDQELLAKATSAANNVSENFHASICAEAEFMCRDRMSLSELMQCYSASKQYKTRMVEILSVRKFLDAHFQVHPAKYELDLLPQLLIDQRLFEERMLKNQVSGGTLVFVWNLLKVQSVEIFDCLDSIERADLVKCEDTARFCFDYFGVRLTHNSSDTYYILLNPNSAWIRNSDKRFILWKRQVATLDVRHFASAAREYWCQEMVSAGLRVLDALQAISMKPSLSKYCQSVYLLHIFDITRFVESKSLGTKKVDAIKLHNFLQLSTKYVEIVFPLDPRQSLSEDMVSLRETEISKNSLEDIVCRNISSKNDELTHRQIGEVVMIMLGSGLKPRNGINYERLIARLSDNTCNWKSFIENLCTVQESSSKEALSHEFQKALVETYNRNWRARDYISPKCFFYLVERLLILVPHCRGHFFTTKSSFAEYLMCLQPEANPSDGLVTDKRSYATNTFKFVADVIRECLYNTQGTAEWINRSNIDCKYYLPVLMLRLFMILCLSCLNSELSFNTLFEVLKVGHVRNQLPWKFCEAIRTRMNYNNNNISDNAAAVAGAFNIIGDPLVIVASTEFNSVKFVCPDSIFLDLKSFSCRSEVIKKLFPNKNSSEASPLSHGDKKVIAVDGNDVVSEQVTTSTKSSNTTLETDPQLNTSKNGEGVVQMNLNWNIIQELFDTVNGNDGDSNNIVQMKMEEMKEHIKILTAEMATHPSEDKKLLATMEELTELSSSLDTSEIDIKAMQKLGELLMSFKERSSETSLLGSNDNIIMPSTSSSSSDEEEEEDEDRKNNSKNGKGKSKNNKKQPKKGKGKGKGKGGKRK
ncbi:hypothetical protein ACP275_08G125400 [Erythranthe tilingii]